jgi:alkyl sulfatase BDS1-like metallo-beta-lactamase superfamily hydrolase
MELKEKNDLIESFATKLPKKSIDDIIDDVTKFTVDEIKTKLSVALADQILTNGKEDKTEFSDVTVNIDNMNKSISREERLIAEIKSKKRK